MAEKYHRPVAVLYLQSPPLRFDPLKRYRRVLEDIGVDLPYELVLAFRRVRMQQDVMQEKSELDDRALPRFDLRLTSSMPTEAAGGEIRAWLTLTLEQQRRWARSDEFVPRLRGLIEDHGMLVT